MRASNRDCLFILFAAMVCLSHDAGRAIAQPPVAEPVAELPVALDGLVGEIAGDEPQRVLKWEPDIAAFETLDAESDDPADAILFLGSSSIRLWETMADDMRPWPIIRRGYGGSSLLDIVHYAPRLMAAHNPRAVVVFAGNDISGRSTDRTPQQVVALFKELCPIVRQGDDDRDVFYIEVTPTPARFDVWPTIRRANDAVKAYCESTPHTHYIATRDLYLDETGQPIGAFFRDDRLHQNDAGYALWTGRIKRELLAVLGTVRGESE